VTAGRALTAEHLTEDFGPASPAGRAVLEALSLALGNALGESLSGGSGPERSAIRRRFEAWAPLYGPAAGAQAALFVSHTLHALLVKLIAAELAAPLAARSSPPPVCPASSMSTRSAGTSTLPRSRPTAPRCAARSARS